MLIKYKVDLIVDNVSLLLISLEDFTNSVYTCNESLKSSVHLDSDPAFSVKLLGVFIDQTLSFDRMINETCTICF